MECPSEVYKNPGRRKRLYIKKNRRPSKYRKPSPAPRRIGNSSVKWCPFCNPKLSIRIDKKKALERDMKNQIKLYVNTQTYNFSIL